MPLSGFNTGIIDAASTDGVSGFNIELIEGPTQLGVVGFNTETIFFSGVPATKGFCIDSRIDLIISVEDTNGDPLNNVTFKTTNSSNSGTQSITKTLLLAIDNTETVTVETSLAGYITKTTNINFVKGTPQRVTIVLSKAPKVLFSCTTTFKNSEGVTVSKPISTGYVEVVFTGDSAVDVSLYSVLFEAIPPGGSKYNSIVLNNELTSSTANTLTYKVEVVQEPGDYCYLSNIIKKIC